MRISIKLILILAVLSTPAVAANLFVPGQFPTIQAAVDASSPGDRVVVGAGDYVGAQITTRVKIVGEGDQTVITHGPNNLGGCCLWFQNGFRIDAGGDGSSIRDLKIDLKIGLVDQFNKIFIFSIFSHTSSNAIFIKNMPKIQLWMIIKAILEYRRLNAS